MKNLEAGLSLIEIVIVMGLLGIIMAIAGTTFSGSYNKQDLNLTSSAVVATLNEARARAIAGDSTYGGVSKRFGVYFTDDSYTLFAGDSYSASDTSNFVTDLEGGVTFSTINIPNSTTLFEKISGEVVGYNASQNSLTLTDSVTGGAKTISFNKLGSVIVQ